MPLKQLILPSSNNKAGEKGISLGEDVTGGTALKGLTLQTCLQHENASVRTAGFFMPVVVPTQGPGEDGCLHCDSDLQSPTRFQ